MQYQIIVFDLDGTLTNSQKKITPKTKQAIEQIQQQGIRVVLASGRPTCGILPIAEELNLTKYGGFVLSFNGANVINMQTQEVIYQKTLPTQIIPSLCEFAQHHKINLLSYEGNTIITHASKDPYVIIESQVNHMQVKQISNLCDYIRFPVHKCMIVGDSDRLEKLEPIAVSQLGGQLNIYRSEPYFLEFMPQQIDKAYSLGKLLTHLGLDKQQMIACGDGFNDISMIAYAGLGVAMQNAQPSVKASADYITSSNDQDGIVKVIETFLIHN